jgi:branched-chain amino acid transport system substrate-binding protein
VSGIRYGARTLGLRLILVAALASFGLAVLGTGTASAKASPYIVGSVGTYTGQDSGDYAGAHDTLVAWEKWTNAHGGINGHQVQLIILDDQSSSTVELQDVEKLVQQDHVMAVVADNSNEDADIGTYLAKNNVALIGATSIPPPPTDSLFFPVGAGELTIAYGDILGAKLLGFHKIGVLYCAEVAVCAQFVPVLKQFAGANDATVSYVSAADENQPSYASYCLAAKQDGAQAFYLALTSASTIAVAQSCQEQGYNAKYVLGGANFGPDELKLSVFNGSLGSEGVFPWVADTTPAEKTFHTAINKYFPSLKSSVNYSTTTADAWADAEMFTAAASKAKAATSAALINGLYSLKAETLGGLIAPVTFTRGKQANPLCFFLMQDKNGKVVPLEGGKYQCEPSS